MPAAVTLKNISKLYRIYRTPRERLKEALSFGRTHYGRDFWALKDIDLTVESGTTLGILGRNGAGKSTLLQVISGVLQPTTGSVTVNGRLAALLQLGAGFNAEFTGRENAILNGLILGIDRREMLERFDEIAAFADLGEFMDQPVKTYSSGMRARLGFAVAVNVEPNILIIDEVLSVGDAVFRQMSLQKMQELRNSGTTIFFVSHGLEMVKNFCNEAILLHEGRLLATGEAGYTLERYRELLAELETERQRGNRELQAQVGQKMAHSDRPGGAIIAGVEILDERDRPVARIRSGSIAKIRTHLEYTDMVASSVLHISLRDRTGLEVFSTSTAAERTPIGARGPNNRVEVDLSFPLPLKQGRYNVSAMLSTGGKGEHLDLADRVALFDVEPPEDRASVKGLLHLPAKVEIHTPDKTGHQERSA